MFIVPYPFLLFRTNDQFQMGIESEVVGCCAASAIERIERDFRNHHCALKCIIFSPGCPNNISLLFRHLLLRRLGHRHIGVRSAADK
jgi:hypothetical protein